MQHRDYIVIQKVIEEMNAGIQLLGTTSKEEFLQNELLKRTELKNISQGGEINVT